MTGRAKGTTEELGKNVQAKLGLNRSILDTAPSIFWTSWSINPSETIKLLSK